MKMARSTTLAVSAAAAVAILTAGVHETSAQNLFQRLIQSNQHGRVQPMQPAEPAEPAAQQAAPRATAPRVSGPSYYTYKTDPLVRVDFAGIVPQREKDAALSAPAGIDRTAVGSTMMEEAPAVAAAEPALADTAQEEAAREDAGPRQRQLLTDAQIAALQAFELLAEKEVAEAIVAHYSAAPEFIWVSEGKPDARAQEAMRVLADAAGHGLDPRDYAVTLPSGDNDAAAAAFEMELSARLLRYIRDAQAGRVDPNRISGYHDFAQKELDRAAMLREAAESEDIAAFLESQHPSGPHYAALRAELTALKSSAENEIVIAPKTVIKPGETSAEFPKVLALIESRADAALKEEYGALLARYSGSDVYDRELAPLIKAAQEAAGIGADGVIGPRTIHALAGDSRASRIEKVLIALEQARWLPSDLAARHVFINTPAFEATYVEDGEEKLSMRTIVGRNGTQTYFFTDEIQYVEFHPYWGVPRSILVNTYLPRLMNDPSYLDRNGFEVTDRRGQKVSSSAIDWNQYGANIPYDVRQLPGSGNALGEMKIMFPNRHAIYMHDTPDKQLFSRDDRALSNGCIRLQDPRGMAAAVLGWTRDEVAERLARPHSRQDLATTVPVYVAYFTAWPDVSGSVRYFGDVYGRDEKMRTAIDMIGALRAPGS